MSKREESLYPPTLRTYLRQGMREFRLPIIALVLFVLIAGVISALQIYNTVGDIAETGPSWAPYLRFDPEFVKLIQTAQWQCSLCFFGIGAFSIAAAVPILLVTMGTVNAVYWLIMRKKWDLSRSLAKREAMVVRSNTKAATTMRRLCLITFVVLGGTLLLIAQRSDIGLESQPLLLFAFFIGGATIISAIVSVWMALMWRRMGLSAKQQAVAARWLALDGAVTFGMIVSIGACGVTAAAVTMIQISRFMMSMGVRSFDKLLVYSVEHVPELPIMEIREEIQRDIGSFGPSFPEVYNAFGGTLAVICLAAIFMSVTVMIPLLYQGFERGPKSLRQLGVAVAASGSMFALLKIVEHFVEEIVVVSLGQTVIGMLLVSGFMLLLVKYLDTLIRRSG